MAWEIEYFEKDNGECPTREFIHRLNRKTDIPYIELRIDQLREHGHTLGDPYVHYLEDGIYELRAKTRNGQFRFFYFFYKRETIVITHGIHKKTDRVPEPEIKKAKEYRSVYQSRKSKI